MRVADHIHLRCPSNIIVGLLGSNFFPKTPKSAKYAGNWDPNLKKPWSYQLQQWILAHFLNQKYESFSVWSLGWSVQNIYPFLRRAILRWIKCD
jgi:hypothetical protein